jgi:hypothetical protein
VVDGVVEDVVERFLVLLFRLDLFRPEPSAEDVVLPAVAFVEGAGILAVQVAHSVGQVRERGLDQQVVVVAEQAAGVQAPAVAAADAPQNLGEGGSVPVVAKDRLVVVALRTDVVVGAGGEVATWSSHRGDRTGGGDIRTVIPSSWRSVGTDVSRARQQTRPQEPRPCGRRRKGRC